MKNILIIVFLSCLLNFSVKANPWLVIEGIGIGVQVLEAGAKKIGDANKSRKAKKRINKEAKNLKVGSKIITFLECNNLEPNYSPNTVFKIDLENKYIKIDEGKKNNLIYFKINNILNSQIISTEAFSPDKKKQKKMNEYNKYIDVTYTFDVEAKTVKILTLLESNAPKKWKKSIAKDIKKGKLANKTDANCMVIGERYLTKKETTKKNNLAKWVAIFEHKEKNIFYTSDNKIEINTREKAINNATSKCWFDPNHKVGDWPSENCEMISVKNINSLDENENNKFPWTAQFTHPKTYKLFVATNLSTKKKAINLAMKKCYDFVTKELKKVGYNDCFLLQAFSTNSKNEKIIITETELKKRKAESDKRKAKEYEKRKALDKSNQRWISENKQNYLDQFTKKLNEYNDIILKLTNKRNKLINKISEFEMLSSKTKEEVNLAINDLTNIKNKEVKDLRDKIKKDNKKYLSNSSLDEYKYRFEYIEKMNFEKYKRYETLKDLMKGATRSKKAVNFIGTDEIIILGIRFKQNKIGFIQRFKNLEKKDLGPEFISDEKIINKLIDDIDNEIININKHVLEPVQTLKLLDEELSNKIDYFKIIRLNPYYWVFNSIYSLR
jgi:hypothetical protein